MQKLRPKQESICLEEMIPSISSHRCGPNMRLTSPSSLRKKIGNNGKEPQSSPRRKAMEMAAALVAMAATNNYDLCQETNENTSNPVELDGQFSVCPTVNVGVINGLGGRCVSPEVAPNMPQEDNAPREYNNTLVPMIIDTGGDIGIGGVATSYECESSADFPATRFSEDDLTLKPFSPDRIPLRSCMKSSDGMQVASSSSHIQTKQEKYQILLPGQTKPIERRRSIAFDNNLDIRCVEPVQLLSAGGRQSLWYQENEYETIKFKTLALLDRVDFSSGVVDGKKYCTRGLEKFMSPEAAEVKKHQAWDSVLSEQFLQRKDGEFDEETLATIYMYATRRSRLEANKRASLDAEAAQAYLETTFRTCSTPHGPDEQRHFDRRVSL